MYDTDYSNRRTIMEIIIGSVIYLIVIALFIAFGKFLKECDEGTSQMHVGKK
jgi:hypothetical protein